MWTPDSSPEIHPNVQTAWFVLPPAGQAVGTSPTISPPAAPTFCASLPSSNSAQLAISGNPIGWLKVGRDIVLRAMLVGVGMYLYDPEDPRLFRRAVAGSLGIEAFVLAWTWIQARKAAEASASGR